MSDEFDEIISAQGLPESFRLTLERVCEPLAARAARLRQVRRKTVTLGLCGPQGSGKSTIGQATAHLLTNRGLTAVCLSLDDFYLTRAVRQRLAAEVHPLLAVRGPPGTHDITLAGAALDQLKAPGRIALPRFDKAADDRAPRNTWATVATPVDVVIFEGWCVGARAQGAAALAAPVNALERDEDADGRWRAWVNGQLDGPYQTLWGKLNEVAFLEAPGFEVVQAWRTEQEHALRRRTGVGMSDEEVGRFLLFYERLTRWMLTEMPGRANLVFSLGADRTPEPVA